MLDSCLLHFNELPLKHLIIMLDGETKGPDSWSGPHGKNIALWCKHPQLYQKKPFAKFKQISGNVPENVDPELLSKSHDLWLLYQFCIGIQRGFMDPKIADYKIGQFTLARWLTQGCYLACMWVHTPEEEVTETMEILIIYRQQILIY